MEKLNDWVEKFVEDQESKEKNNLKKEILDAAERIVNERHHKNEQRQLYEIKEYM